MNSLIEIGSEISRNANCNLLGDCSGKTISRRTGLGLKKGLNLNVTTKVATDMAHVGMGALLLLLRSKSKNSQNLGLAIAGGLFLAYHN